MVIGRRAQRYQGGTAMVPYQRWVHDFPNVAPYRTTLRFFRRYAFYTCFICGNALAFYMTDRTRFRNSWYTRPDLKAKAAMVKDDPNFDDVAYQQLL